MMTRKRFENALRSLVTNGAVIAQCRCGTQVVAFDPAEPLNWCPQCGFVSDEDVTFFATAKGRLALMKRPDRKRISH